MCCCCLSVVAVVVVSCARLSSSSSIFPSLSLLSFCLAFCFANTGLRRPQDRLLGRFIGSRKFTFNAPCAIAFYGLEWFRLFAYLRGQSCIQEIFSSLNNLYLYSRTPLLCASPFFRPNSPTLLCHHLPNPHTHSLVCSRLT